MAQTDLSGIWNLNKSKSILKGEKSMAPELLVLIQTTDLLTVEKHTSLNGKSYTITENYTLDGKECINPIWENFKKKSTAVWSDDKNSLKIITKIPMQGDKEISILEIYQLTENSLKITTSTSSSFGDNNEVYLFDK
jgi:hypothetical protein